MVLSAPVRLALALLAAVCAWPSAAGAWSATVRWTHSSPSLVAGFRVYVRSAGGSYGAPAYDGLPTPVNGVYSVQLNLPDAGTAYVSGRSYGPGGESALSNEMPAAPPAPVCGDGVRQGAEACDDGDTVGGDGCRANCTVELCGDRIVDSPAEQCDDGNQTLGDGCESCRTARIPACGDGIRDAGEACDDGNRTSGDGCRSTCTVELCGDRIVDSPAEQCDDGNQTLGDGCESCRTARIPACGDGIRDAGEACDDGNRTSGDGCRSTCTVELCGDRIVDSPTEQCDDGNQTLGDGCESCRTARIPACGDGIRDAGETCDDGNRTSGDGCRSTCTVELCGDRIVDSPTEQCDDGNQTLGDGCESCRTVAQPSCGNGTREGNEACDDGNRTSGDGCRSTCTVELCGDRIVDPPTEQCDDGNQTLGDGCESCRTVVQPSCGNGTREGNEACDDGNRSNGDGCRSNCTVEMCGDRIVDPVERCDDGNRTAGDGCRGNCTIEACADGILDSPREACDDGNRFNGDGCRANCTVEACGDGVRDLGEGCDDGNRTSGDGCRASCTTEICGDAIFDPPREQCDDGNRVAGDGCESCRSVSPPACGDGTRDPGEGCDDGNTISGDGCDANCTPSGCGNGAVGVGEACDDGNASSGDGCDANCTPTGCGNGVLTDGEACDDGNVEDGDGCSALCEAQDVPQSRAQIRCIVAVNRGVARIARMQARQQRRCFDGAIRGTLGDMPAVFDACLEADLQGEVAEAEEKLDATEAEACVPEELPTLALGDDRLSGLPGASVLPAALVRDLFGAPADPASLEEAAEGARCQREVLRSTAALFDAVWRELPDAEAAKLEGDAVTPPATTDAELGAYLEQALAESALVARKTAKVLRRTLASCTQPELATLFPGCAPEHTLDLAGCAVATTRCRACQLAIEANPRLPLDCDAFDDLHPNGTCATASAS